MIGSRRMHLDAEAHAKQLRAWRLRAHMSQATMAATLGVSRRTVCRWESGKGRLHKVYLRRIRELADNGREVTSDAL